MSVNQWDALPLDMRKIIFGMTVKCCRCGKFMCDDSSMKAVSPFLEIKTGLRFCGRKCIEETVAAFEGNNIDEILIPFSYGAVIYPKEEVEGRQFD